MRTLLAILIVAVVIALAWMSVFTVNPTEFAYLTQFGSHVDTFDGSLTDTDAGLHFRWPWPVQSVRRFDRRLQTLDLPAIELLTRDNSRDQGVASSVDKTLTVEAYVCWRIADKHHVDRFVRRIDTPDRARLILAQRVNGQLGAFIGQLRMDDLVSTEVLPGDNEDGDGPTPVTRVERTMHKLREDLLDALRGPVLEEYGIEIVDVRLKRFNHPVNVRNTIFLRIKSERELKAAHYRNEGRKRAEDIRTVAEAKKLLLTKAAEKVEKEAKLEAEAEAESIRAAAYKEDIRFFSFWQQLEQMKSILGNPKTTLLLSTHRSVFDFLFNAPGPSGQPAVVRPDPAGRDQGTTSDPKKDKKEVEHD